MSCVLFDDTNRFTLFPIKDNDIFVLSFGETRKFIHFTWIPVY